jgi:hypothetical protein
VIIPALIIFYPDFDTLLLNLHSSKMSSLYSRWVPPKKSNAPIEAPQSPAPQTITVATTPPSTLYARYIPPKNNARTIPHHQSPAPLIPTQPEDEEPKPKKRRKIEKKEEEQPKKDKKDKKKHKSRKSELVEESTKGLGDIQVEETAPEIEADEDEGQSDSEEGSNAKAQAILAKYRNSVQIQTAINAKKAKLGIRTPTPEPELHGNVHILFPNRPY